jgi:hypothetical protein
MSKQGREVKWIPFNLLLNKVKGFRRRFGNYKVVVTSGYGDILVNDNNFKALVPVQGKYYRADDFKKWLDRGFIVVVFHNVDHGNRKYYILNAKKGNRVCTCNGIYADMFLKGKSDYFVVSIRDHGYKYAIFNKNGKQITNWYNMIYSSGLVDGESDYYIVEKGSKEAIFYKNDKRISGWFDTIYSVGLVEGKSSYYVAKKNEKQAVFYRSGKQISDWFNDIILKSGLFTGKSDYFVVKNDVFKEAIFDKNGKQISNWFDEICLLGLVYGESDYYIAKKDGKEAIFHKDGRQISNWHDVVYANGLVVGETPYYLSIDQQFYHIHKLGTSNKIGPFKVIFQADFVNDPLATEIIVETLDGKKEKISKQEADEFFESKDQGIEQII